MNTAQPEDDSRSVFFFDIDNCLYSREKLVLEHINEAIDEYVVEKLVVSLSDARQLRADYAVRFGLVVNGLNQLHGVDPMEFNRKVDDAIPLNKLLGPDAALRRLLTSFDRNKVKLWLFTNAHVTHGERVVRMLGVDDLFEGITYCDYRSLPLRCKPDPATYMRAMADAGVRDPSKCYFVDDSAGNCRGAEEVGCSVVHFLEGDMQIPEQYVCSDQVQSLYELRDIFPQLFTEVSRPACSTASSEITI